MLSTSVALLKAEKRFLFRSTYRVRIELYRCGILAAADTTVTFYLATEPFPPSVQLRVRPVAFSICEHEGIHEM